MSESDPCSSAIGSLVLIALISSYESDSHLREVNSFDLQQRRASRIAKLSARRGELTDRVRVWKDSVCPASVTVHPSPATLSRALHAASERTQTAFVWMFGGVYKRFFGEFYLTSILI